MGEEVAVEPITIITIMSIVPLIVGGFIVALTSVVEPRTPEAAESRIAERSH
jgi:hypothetical protein